MKFTVPHWLRYGFFYFAVSQLQTIYLAVDNQIPPIWLAAGIALAGVIQHGIQILPGIFLASFSSLLLSGTPLFAGIGVSVAATVEAAVGGLLIRHLGKQATPFYTPKSTVTFILATTILPPLTGALIGSFTLWYTAVIGTHEFIVAAMRWGASDLSGILILTPLFIGWQDKAMPQLQQGKLQEALALFILTIGTSVLLFSDRLSVTIQQYPLTFLTVLPLAWALFRFHTRTVTLVAATTSVAAIWGTLNGCGPFIQQGDTALSTLLLQLYVGTICTFALLSKSALQVQDRILKKAAIAKKIVTHMPDGLVITNSRGAILSANPAFYRSSGLKPADIIGQPMWSLDVEADGESNHEIIQHELNAKGEWQGEVRTQSATENSHPEWLKIITIRKRHGVSHYLRIYSHFAHQEKLNKRINRLVYYDKLTRLPNRELFNDRLEQAIKQAIRKRNLVGLLFLDLDRFKHINDTLGHSIGDQLLAEAAERLRNSVRNVDSLARFGGDEFTLILQDIDEDFDAILVADKILSEFKAPFKLEQHKLYLSTSIGIAIFPDHGTTVDDIIKHADTAMYRAKQSGGNKYKVFERTMSEPFLWNLEVETALRHAIEKREIQLVYQPQFDLDTGAITGLEALARWNDPKLGPVGPDTFIQVAENTGLIHQLGEQIMLMAGRQILKWSTEGLTGLRIYVNVSAMQLQQPEFTIIAKETVKLLRNSGNSMAIELTETSMMENAALVEKVLYQLAELGMEIAIDDFGTGYSSLSYLKKLPISLLKIDKSFIKELPGNSNDSAICKAIIAMAKSLNIRVIAEGVETEKQMHFLHQESCNEMQGFLYSKPLSPEEISEMIKLKYWHVSSMKASLENQV